MEIKFRRKGETVCIPFPYDKIPEGISVPEGFEGVDLTGYSVISVFGGKKVPARAEELHKQAPRAIVLWSYNWTNGFGDGIYLPENFDPRRVKFYRTQNQEEELRQQEKLAKLSDLAQEIEGAIPDVWVRVNDFNHSVEITPRQEAFNERWHVYWAHDVEEAREGVARMRPLWDEVNALALRVYERRGLKAEMGSVRVKLHGYQAVEHPEKGVNKINVEFYDDKSSTYRLVTLCREESGWTEMWEFEGRILWE